MKFKRDNNWMLFGKNSHEFTWKGVKYLLWVYFASLLFAAVVTGPVFTLFKWVAAETNWKLFVYLVDGRSFDDFFDRLRMIPIVAGLPWLLVACGLFSFANLGVKFNREQLVRFAIWFGVGVVILTVVIAAQFAFGNVGMRQNATLYRWSTVLLAATASGVAVALVEEIVFRGLVFRIFYTAVRPITAIVLSSLFFAYVHFKVPDVAAGVLEHSSEWWMGLYTAFWMLFGITVNFSWMAFLNLFVFGVLLCLIFLRTRSLLACMGLHAGVVWLRLSYIKLFDVSGHPMQRLLGSGKVIDGLFPLIVLTGVCVYLVVSKPRAEECVHTSSRKCKTR